MVTIQKTKSDVSECEFVYRIQLNLKPGEQASEGRLTELVRAEMKGLLDVVSLFYRGERVEVDAFAFVNDETILHNLY